MKKRLPGQAYLALLLFILLLVTVTAGTYAWFTFRDNVNVQPMSGNVGMTDGSLLIAVAPVGVFDKTCQLPAACPEGGLKPLSSADLTRFFSAAAQNSDGIVTRYRSADAMVDAYAIHGHIYLKSTKNPANVYLDKAGLDFGTDIQALASMRLGLLVRVPGAEPKAFIFRLDDMADVSEASVRRTVPEEYAGMVVSGTGVRPLEMIPDPALDLSKHWAVRQDAGGVQALTLTAPMFTLEAEVVADVEFWLYLEGCDDNCQNLIDGVQNRDAALALAFYGDIMRANNG